MIQYKSTPIQGLWEIYPETFGDQRGAFTELIQYPYLYQHSNCEPFVQENESVSSFGVLRGLHLQKGDAAQAKLVRCSAGAVLDVVVDLRLHSATFGKHHMVKLDSKLRNQLFIPRGFAHAFLVLTSSATFNYKTDNLYAPHTECNIHPFDKDINIDWIAASEGLFTSTEQFILSQKDLNGISFKEFCTNVLNMQ